MWICSRLGFYCISLYDGPCRVHEGDHWLIESPNHQDLVNLLGAMDVPPGLIDHRSQSTLRFAVILSHRGELYRVLQLLAETISACPMLVAMEDCMGQEDKIEAYANLKEDLLLKADGWEKQYFRNHKPNCEWHRALEPVDYDGEHPNGVACPDCGRMLGTRNCDGCGEEFIDYSDQGYDDIVTAARVSSSGDLTCVVCLDRHEQAEEMEDYNA